MLRHKLAGLHLPQAVSYTHLHNVLFVSESGVSSTEDVAKLREIGADAVLIGETLMRASDKKVKLDELRGAV